MKGIYALGFCESLINDAKKETIKCLETGEEIRAVPFGDKRNKESGIFVSNAPYKIMAMTSFVVAGEKFFLDHQNKE